MESCWLYVLWQGRGGTCWTRSVLPPMTIPQMLLPERARFCGVGIIDGEDAYLFAVKGTPDCEEVVKDQQLCALLEKLTECAEAQSFVLSRISGVWCMENEMLEEKQY